MSARDDAERYAMDLMVEVGWDDDALDDELARKTLTLMASGDPKEIVPRLVLTFKVVRAAERLAAAREPCLARPEVRGGYSRADARRPGGHPREVQRVLHRTRRQLRWVGSRTGSGGAWSSRSFCPGRP